MTDAVQAVTTAIHRRHPTAGIYLVGGCVRDQLLSRPAKDQDLVVTALSAPELEAALRAAGATVALVGASFGVYKATLRGETLDVALPRTETSTGPGHADFDIHAGQTAAGQPITLHDDLARRDLTVNAMALCVLTGTLVDPHGGTRDLIQGVLRAVGDPDERLREDPLRILRALRLSAQLDLRVDGTLLAAIGRAAPLLRHLAPERIQQELWRLLSARKPGPLVRALHDANDTGVLDEVLPEWRATRGYDQRNPHHHLPLDQHTLAAVRYAANRRAGPRALLALLLHDLGKPATQTFGEDGHAHYYGHEEVSARIAHERLHALKFPGAVITDVVRLVAEHMRPAHGAGVKGVRRWANQLGDLWPEALTCREADLAAHRLPVGFSAARWAQEVRDVLSAAPEVAALREQTLAVTGGVIAQRYGLSGRAIGDAKRAAVDACVAGDIENTPDAVLAFLDAQLGGAA